MLKFSLDLLIPKKYVGVENFLIPKLMSKKMGRPRLPKGQAKGVQIGVRFNPKDDKQIDRRVVESGQTKADWVRNAAVAETKVPPVWIKSKWTWEDLRDKTVEFRLIAPRFQVEGMGKFLVRINPAGELAVEICAIESATRSEIVESRFYLFQQVADKIERHPNPAVAAFRLLM
jgi:hypothetical protein